MASRALLALVSVAMAVTKLLLLLETFLLFNVTLVGTSVSLLTRPVTV